jgi:putative pyruvate formate lyase activating enzyme
MASLAELDGVVDIYMPDFKYWDERAAAKLLKAKDYPAVARRVIREMHRQVGDLVVDDDGLAVSGLLVRHLVMPGSVDDSARILTWLRDEISPATYVNVMDQYRPEGAVLRQPDRYAAIGRATTADEHARALAIARDAGLRVDERRPHRKLRGRLPVLW